jgi:PhzF family phenazine biosynthesis protein
MRQFLIDAFASGPFRGNQACVLEPLAAWPSDAWLQALAAENNQAETAYLLPTEDPARFGLRWFTPALEVPLCGHATLAAAHVLYAELGATAPALTFDTLSGPLIVQQTDGGYAMDFPADTPDQADLEDAVAAELERALGVRPDEVWVAGYMLALFEDPEVIARLEPDMALVKQIGAQARRERGNLVCAAPAPAGSGFDVISRFFAPGSGIPEDPATGSAHCIIAPLFARRLGKDRLACFQAYPGRGGEITCTLRGDRVLLEGRAVTIADSSLRIQPG